jgi:iron complex outermembrane receptor protein
LVQIWHHQIKAYFDGIPLTTGDGETTLDDLDLASIEKSK